MRSGYPGTIVDDEAFRGPPSPYDPGPEPEDHLWLLPADDDVPDRPMLDPVDWLAAEAQAAGALARAAMAVGRLDELVAAMGPGAVTRLALIEIEAMLWSAGTPLPREEVGRDLMGARAGSDPGTMAQARWGLRRLAGQGALDNLRAFLGLHRAESAGLAEPLTARPTGAGFDEAAENFAAMMAGMAAAHPFTSGAFARAAWRLAEISPADEVIEPAVWSARHMAGDCEVLPFLPLGRARQAGGTPADRLRAHYRAVEAGATAARAALVRLRDWAARARAATARIKGDNPARVIEALLARPLSLSADIETSAGISRATAERLLARMHGMGLVREVTGTRRFRIWGAGA